MTSAQRFWNRKAKGYDDRLPAKGPNYAARLTRVAQVIPPDGRLLDVGCATGEITLDLAEHCGEVLGIDTAGDMIDLANTKAVQRGIKNARFKAIGPDDETLEPGSFDAVACYSVFHLIDDYPAMVRRFAELLKPGGHVLNETPCLGNWGPWWRPVLWGARAVGAAPNVRFIKAADLEQSFRDAGLEIVESTVHNPKSGQHNILARKP